MASFRPVGDAEVIVSEFCFSHMFAKWKNILSDAILARKELILKIYGRS
jgi:hypothetical protein